MKIYIFETSEVDPYKNLATEEYLLRLCEKEYSAVLYLWQNKDAIILGRNQNPYTECNLKKAEEKEVKIARRMTGGGAVFHDLGNLNFTFILPKCVYRQKDTIAVIKEALAEFGLDVQVSGRNDILAAGYKFSGNAFYSNEKSALHHGTILVDSDLNKMNMLLRVSSGKLKRKGVASIHSRVVNLCEIQPDISISLIKAELKRKYIEILSRQCVVERVDEKKVDIKSVPVNLKRKYESEEWIYGNYSNTWEFNIKRDFDWGNIILCMNMEKGRIMDMEIDSDTLFQELIGLVKEKFRGVNAQGYETVMNEIIDGCENKDELEAAVDIKSLMRELFESEGLNDI